MAERREVRVAYDRASDVLYVTFGVNVPAISVEVQEGVLARLNPDTKEMVGMTVIGLSDRTVEQSVAVEPVRGSLTYDAGGLVPA
jgi:hypothetical protein